MDTPGAAVGATLAWPTYRHDAARSGLDPDSTSPVPPTQTWQTAALDGAIYAQPLLYGSNVYVATENNTVYALNASTGAIAWQKHLANPVPSGELPCGDIDTVGITSTPVIDSSTGKLFVVADTLNGGSVQHQLFGLSLNDGSVAAGPLDVDPPGSVPKNQLQRTGLALQAGKVIIGYGGNYGDCDAYHGWLLAVAEGGGSIQSFKVDPSSNGGAIWGSGNAPPIDSAGDIWISTGNGQGSGFGNQESVIKLDGNMTMLDQWAPANWSSLDSTDADIGSSMPVLLPGGLVFEIGKTGEGYLLSASGLGGTGAPPVYQAGVCSGSYGGGIYTGGVIYVACSDGTHALSLDTTNHRFSALGSWHVNGAADGPPIFAGGLVWSTGSGDGTLYGLDPSSGATRFSADLGGFEHFASPSAGGGELFVANRDRVTAFHIAKYGLTPPPSPGAAAPAISRLHVNVLRLKRKLRITFTVTEATTVTVRLGTRKWVVHARRGSDTFRLRWRKLTRGPHRLFVVARNAAGRRSERYVVHFRF